MKHALDTVIDVGEGSGLLAISAHLKLLFGCHGLAAEGSRNLLLPTLPGSEWKRAMQMLKEASADKYGEGGQC